MDCGFIRSSDLSRRRTTPNRRSAALKGKKPVTSIATGVTRKWNCPPRKCSDWYRQMSLIPTVRSESSAQSYQQQKIGGFCHLYVGQEAVAVGSIAATKPTDYIITAYRDHGHAIARGMQSWRAFRRVVREGVAGCSHGKGGPMHFFDKRELFWWKPRDCRWPHIPLAVGLGWAAKYRKEDRVTLCYFGDGAMNQGIFPTRR